MAHDPLDGVAVFLAVADALGFTAAARRLGVTPTAVSKAIRAFEARHGVALFQRTTRRVALTEAGTALAERLRPASAEIADALAALGGFRDRPMGTLRITASASAASTVLAHLLPLFRRAAPDVMLDVTSDDALLDLVGRGFDAGIRLGDAVEKDMVAVRLTPEIGWSIAGSPDYFARAGRPRTPEELVGHEALRYRFGPAGAVHRWGFRRGRRAFVVDVGGHVVVDDRRLLVELACAGLGLAFVSDPESRAAVAAGRLERTLQAHIPRDAGLYLCFPRHAQRSPKLRAFIASARELLAAPAYVALFGDIPARR